MEYITFVYAMLLSLAQTCMGFILVKGLGSTAYFGGLTKLEKEVNLLPVLWVLGLLVHLTTILALKIFGVAWWLAIVAPMSVIAVYHRSVPDFFHLVFAAIKQLASIPFLVWLILQFFIGASLFTMRDGISTPWINNYGDLAFHLGMISNFAAREEFPADYHLFAGEQLSYPFFINFWAVVLWFPFSSFMTLKVVFIFQWLALWVTVYALLAKRRAFYLPWVLFFGGGSYFALIAQPDVYSWQLISEGYPWTTWLSTIWVTQRSALFGLAASVSAACLALNSLGVTANTSLRWRMAVAGIILGLMPLVHTHFFLFTALFLGFYVFFLIMKNLIKKGFSMRLAIAEANKLGLITLISFSLLALIFFPLLLGKSGMTSPMLGWTVPFQTPGWGSLVSSAGMWVKNAPHWLFAMVVLCIVTREYLLFASIFLLFVLANLVKLASWEWDQLKVFLVVFTMMVVVWRYYIQAKNMSRVHSLVLHLIALVLIGPGAYEAARIWRESPSYQVYRPEKIELAELISQNVANNEILASQSDHNSAATLSGRTIFFGYPGTLASHNIDYQSRETIQKSLTKLRSCRQFSETAKNCPDYIVWDAKAGQYWGVPIPGEGYSKVAATKDKKLSVYRIIH